MSGLEARLNARLSHLTRLAFVVGTLFHTASFGFERFLVPRDAVFPTWWLTGSHVVSLAILAVWLRRKRRTGNDGHGLMQLTGVVTVLAFAGIIIYDAVVAPNLGLCRSWVAYIMVSQFVIVMFPTFDKRRILYATLLMLPPEIIAWILAGGDRWKVAICGALGLSLVAAIKFGLMRDGRNSMRLEQATIDAKERAAKLAFDREMALARQVQDGVDPPPLVRYGDLTVRCCIRRHQSVGGDWGAHRREADGRVIVAVADAAGKGLQAALIAHSLETLWASAMDETRLDVEVWLRRVNATLMAMGQSSTHAASAGVIEMTGSELRYWSAGHLPLIALLGDGPGGEVKRLTATGDLLGISPELRLNPVVLSALTGRFSVLLATDGVFYKGSKHRSKDFVDLDAALRTGNMGLIEDLPSGDDKFVMRLAREAA